MRTAVFSKDRRHRFRLTIELGLFGAGRCVFIMLNPSTANEFKDDPTVRRCQGFARKFGCNELDVVNIFAFRSTSPEALYALERDYAVGQDNDAHILAACVGARVVVCAWGNHGLLHRRGLEVKNLLASIDVKPMCLSLTKADQPGHPLYLPANAALFDI